jgi:hypothetical protein
MLAPGCAAVSSTVPVTLPARSTATFFTPLTPRSTSSYSASTPERPIMSLRYSGFGAFSVAVTSWSVTGPTYPSSCAALAPSGRGYCRTASRSALTPG